MDTITVNGHELSIDLMEADSLEKFENALGTCQRKVDDKNLTAGMSHADMYRFQCKCVDEFFNEVFGPGTAVEIFGPNNTNIRDHVDAFGKAALMPVQSGEEVVDIMNEYTSKAGHIGSPGMNRQQRRAQAKRDRKAARNAQTAQETKPAQGETKEEKPAEAALNGPISVVEDNTQEELDSFVSGLTDEQKVKLAEALASDKA